MERFDEDVAKVNEMSGLSFDLEGLSSGHHVSKNETVSPGAFDMKWSALSNRIPSYSSFYDSQTERMVSTLYEDDFASYGYSNNSLDINIVNQPRAVARTRNWLARRSSHAKYMVYDIIRYAALSSNNHV